MKLALTSIRWQRGLYRVYAIWSVIFVLVALVIYTHSSLDRRSTARRQVEDLGRSNKQVADLSAQYETAKAQADAEPEVVIHRSENSRLVAITPLKERADELYKRLEDAKREQRSIERANAYVQRARKTWFIPNQLTMIVVAVAALPWALHFPVKFIVALLLLIGKWVWHGFRSKIDG